MKAKIRKRMYALSRFKVSYTTKPSLYVPNEPDGLNFKPARTDLAYDLGPNVRSDMGHCGPSQIPAFRYLKQ